MQRLSWHCAVLRFLCVLFFVFVTFYWTSNCSIQCIVLHSTSTVFFVTLSICQLPSMTSAFLSLSLFSLFAWCCSCVCKRAFLLFLCLFYFFFFCFCFDFLLTLLVFDYNTFSLCLQTKKTYLKLYGIYTTVIALLHAHLKRCKLRP